VPAALRITSKLNPVLPHLDHTLKTAQPIIDQLGPYKCAIVNAAVVLRSMTGFGGTGHGPSGPAQEFRLQAAAGAEAAQIHALKPHRDAYHPPCKYLAGHSDVLPLTGLGNGHGILGGGR
jgi:hypothetical protein